MMKKSIIATVIIAIFSFATVAEAAKGKVNTKPAAPTTQTQPTTANNRVERKIVYATDAMAAVAAAKKGYTRTNYRTKSGAVVFKKGNSYISRDVDGHNGGAWKEAASPEALNQKSTRRGTLDKDMNRIGD